MRACEFAKIWSHDKSETYTGLKYHNIFTCHHLQWGQQCVLMQYMVKNEMR